MSTGPSRSRASSEQDAPETAEPLDDAQRTCHVLESELQLALCAMRRKEETHDKEMAALEARSTRAMQDAKAMMEKLHAIHKTEDAVRELYVQLKDRTADGPPDPERLQAEISALRNENVLITLGKLQAELRSLWAFKVDAEADLRGRSEGSALAQASKIRALQLKLNAAKAAAIKAQELQALAEARADAADAARRSAVDDGKASLASLGHLNQELVRDARAMTDEIAHLKALLAQSREEGKKRDSLVLRNKQLESAGHFERVAHDKVIRSIQQKHREEVQSMARECAQIPILLRRLQEAQTGQQEREKSCQSYRTSQAAATVQTLETENRRLKRQLESLLSSWAALQQKNHRLAGQSQLAKTRGKRVQSARVLRCVASRTGPEEETDARPEAHPVLRYLADVDALAREPKDLILQMRELLGKDHG